MIIEKFINLSNLDLLNDSLINAGFIINSCSFYDNKIYIDVEGTVSEENLFIIYETIDNIVLLSAKNKAKEDLKNKLEEIENGGFNILCEDSKYHYINTTSNFLKLLNQEVTLSLVDSEYIIDIILPDKFIIAKNNEDILMILSQVSHHLKYNRNNYNLIYQNIENAVNINDWDINIGWKTTYSTWKSLNNFKLSNPPKILNSVNLNNLNDGEFALNPINSTLVFRNENKFNSIKISNIYQSSFIFDLSSPISSQLLGVI